MARLSGMPGLATISLTQATSQLGSGMTNFAILIWAWDLTGEATALALVAFFSFLPRMLMSPLAGALVDRWNRKVVMGLSDLAAGMTTVAVLLLYTTGHLQIWHLYVTGAISGAFGAFQFPAYSAAISTMLPKEQYGRASGMFSLARSVPGIAAPLLAGVLLVVIGIPGILVIDIVTFSLAVVTLLFLHVPQPAPATDSSKPKGLWQDSLYGFRYIFAIRSLLGLQLVFFVANLVAVLGFTVLSPMILARSGNNEVILGTVRAASGIGGLLGGLLLSFWGGPKRKIHGILTGVVLVSIFGQVLMGVGRDVVLWSCASFVIGALPIIINGANQAIWQSKVDPSVQGRVFATRSMIAQITTPLAMLLAGPLADFVFEPAMMPGGALAPVFGPVVGTGTGAGMALMLVLSGALAAVVGVAGYAVGFVRDVEDLIPDHDAETAVPVTASP